MSYSHRNGETDVPTVRGWYWVWVSAPYPVWPGVLMRFVEDYVEDDVPLQRADAWRVDSICHQDLASLGDSLQWWGPVTPPWEEGL